MPLRDTYFSFVEATKIRDLQRLAAEVVLLRAEAEVRSQQDLLAHGRAELAAREAGWRSAVSGRLLSSDNARIWSAAVRAQIDTVALAEGELAAAEARSARHRITLQQATARHEAVKDRTRLMAKAVAKEAEALRDRVQMDSHLAVWRRREKLA